MLGTQRIHIFVFFSGPSTSIIFRPEVVDTEEGISDWNQGLWVQISLCH